MSKYLSGGISPLKALIHWYLDSHLTLLPHASSNAISLFISCNPRRRSQLIAFWSSAWDTKTIKHDWLWLRVISETKCRISITSRFALEAWRSPLIYLLTVDFESAQEEWVRVRQCSFPPSTISCIIAFQENHFQLFILLNGEESLTYCASWYHWLIL